MPLVPQETTLFRRIEETVLDKKHLSFELFQYHIHSAIRSSVQYFDQCMCEAIRAGKGEQYLSQVANA